MADRRTADNYDLYRQAAQIKDPAQRDGFLQSRCGDDPALVERLRAMLAVRDEADALFESAAQFHPAAAVDGVADEAPLGRVGRFRLEKLVGRGGMGNVFLGHDEQLGRLVALKFPRLDTMGNPQLLDRFLREARLAAQLSHPNLVEIYEVGVWGQACFIASQWCEGGDLAAWLVARSGPQDPTWSARLLRSVARAVAYCHQQGVVHLDIKPANIILEADAERDGDGHAVKPILTDFGVARVIEESLAGSHTSLLLGTPLYMAPEQAECDRERIGPASDVFALGVVLHELLYGFRPFEGESAIDVLDQLRAADTLSLPRNKAVPRELATICQRCLQRDPASRYPSADALAEDLDRHLRGEPIHARPVSLVERFGRWLQRFERIVQAGIIALVVQLMILSTFVLHLARVALGWSPLANTDIATLATQYAILTFAVHLPCTLFAWMTLRGTRWAVFLGAIMSLCIAAAVGEPLITGESRLSLYNDNPLAAMLIHQVLFGFAVIQVAAYLAALPATVRLGK